MQKIKTYCDWDLAPDFESSRQVELFVDNSWSVASRDTNSIKVLFVCEPRVIFSGMVDVAIKHQSMFDFILTFDEKILSSCSNAVLFEYGTTWIPDSYEFKPKEFSVSTIVGQKSQTEGHKLRHQLWEQQSRIKTLKRFYKSRHGAPMSFSNNPTLTGPKEPLFDSQFHVCIENSRIRYYFTEKLMDCFRSKTVPIYWGSPNIDSYFNRDGMFICNSLEEIINACNGLTSETYEKMLLNVEDNYARSDKYKNLSVRLSEKLKELISK